MTAVLRQARDRRDRGSRRDSTLEIALLIPLHGSAGIFGPSCELCARLAVEELNGRGGVLDRELRMRVLDGSRPPLRVAEKIDRIVTAGEVDAIVGWQISAVRQAVAPRIAGRVPYVYTALYEGGERTPGVFLVGETPTRQLLPAMRWLRRERGLRRWCIVGNDYVWPRRTALAADRFAQQCDGEVVGRTFVPLGTKSFGRVFDQIRQSRADGVLMLLVGDDSVHFNRQFARAGLDERCPRVSTLVDENVLMASGAGSTHDLWAAAAYFETLITPESFAFGSRYARRFGPDAPSLNSVGESCYEGILMLAALAEQANSIDVGAMGAAADSVSYAGPRGEMRMHDRHADQRIYLADAHDLEFDVATQL